MKKIIAILVALAVVSMAFAQTVSVKNELYTCPVITVNGANCAWSWDDNTMLRDRIDFSAETADGRAKVYGRVGTRLAITDPAGAGLLNVLPRIGIVQSTQNAWWWDLGATYKCTDFLAFGMGSGEGSLHYKAGGYTGGCGDIYWENNADFNGANGMFGSWKNYARVQGNGIFVALLGGGIGLDGFTAVLGFDNDWFNKNMASFNFGVKYNADVFGVSARYHGSFGDQYHSNVIANAAYGATTGSADRKSDYSHEFYVGANYSGLKDLAVGIDLGAGFLAQLGRTQSTATNRMAASIQSSFDFRNGITDALWLTVGFGRFTDGNNNVVSAKVLPFGIGNKLAYKIGGDYNATFKFDIAYMQDFLSRKLKDSDGKVSPNFSMDIYISPSFSWTMGKSTFEIGLRNDVKGHLGYTEKTANDWAFTRVFGDEAKIRIPMSWTYQF